jgi:ribonuclease E
MSRQRLRSSFLEIYSNMCSHCSGKGVVRGDESNAMLILRTVENEIHNGNFATVNVYASSASIVYLLNEKRDEIIFIEKKYSVKLNFFIDINATSDSYSMEKIKLLDKHKTALIVSEPVLQGTSEIYNEFDPEASHKPQKRKIEKSRKKPTSEKKLEKTSDENTEKKISQKLEPKNIEDSVEVPKTEDVQAVEEESNAKKPAKNRKRITKKPNKKEPKKIIEKKED